MACYCYMSREALISKLAYDPQLPVVDAAIYTPYEGPIDMHPDLQHEGGIVVVHNGPPRRTMPSR